MIQQLAASEPINQYMAANPPAPMGGGGGGNPYVPTGSMDPEDQFTLGMAGLGTQQKMGMAELASQERQANLQAQTWRDKNATDKSIAEMRVGAEQKMMADQRAHETSMMQESRRQQLEDQKRQQEAVRRVSEKMMSLRGEHLRLRAEARVQMSANSALLEVRSRAIRDELSGLEKSFGKAVYDLGRQYGQDVTTPLQKELTRIKGTREMRRLALERNKGMGAAELQGIETMAANLSAEEDDDLFDPALKAQSSRALASSIARSLEIGDLDKRAKVSMALEEVISASDSGAVNGNSETSAPSVERLQNALLDARVDPEQLFPLLESVRLGLNNSMGKALEDLSKVAPNFAARFMSTDHSGRVNIEGLHNQDFAKIRDLMDRGARFLLEQAPIPSSITTELLSSSVVPQPLLDEEQRQMNADPSLVARFMGLAGVYNMFDAATSRIKDHLDYQDDASLGRWETFYTELLDSPQERFDRETFDRRWSETGETPVGTLSRERLASILAQLSPSSAVEIDLDTSDGDSTDRKALEALPDGERLLGLLDLIDKSDTIYRDAGTHYGNMRRKIKPLEEQDLAINKEKAAFERSIEDESSMKLQDMAMDGLGDLDMSPEALMALMALSEFEMPRSGGLP